MKGKEIFLLILIIAIGISFSHIHSGEWDLSIDWDEGFFINTEEFTFKESQELEPPFPSEILIRNKHGDIRIEGTDENRIHFDFEKKINRRNEEDALDISERLHPVINRVNDLLVISTNREEFRRKNFRTNFTLYVPANTDVQIRNSYGLVEVLYLGETDIFNRHGEVIAYAINGDLTTENSYKDVEIEDVVRDCRINSSNSTIRVRKIGGSTMINHRHGRIVLEDIEQNVTIDSPHTKIIGENLVGQVEIDNSYKSITLTDVGPTIIRGNNSSVYAERVNTSLEISNRYARINLSDIQGNLQIDGKDVGVVAKGISADRIYISTTYKDVELEDFSGETTISLSNGDLILRPIPLTHSIDVKGSYLGIKLFWPGDALYPIEAQVKNGRIHWNLDQEPDIQVENGLSILKAFLEEPTPKISLSTRYGNIQIDRSIQQ